MCSEDQFLDEQCLDEKILGQNRFFFLRKCRLNQACQILTKSPKRLLFMDKVVVLPPQMRPTGVRNGRKVKNEL